MASAAALGQDGGKDNGQCRPHYVCDYNFSEFINTVCLIIEMRLFMPMWNIPATEFRALFKPDSYKLDASDHVNTTCLY
jgi:hypothetical protein